MHGAAAHGDVDVVVGDDAGEALGDAAQFDGGRGAGRGRRWGARGGVDGALSSGGKARLWRANGLGGVGVLVRVNVSRLASGSYR
jgi:hypothetical protein